MVFEPESRVAETNKLILHLWNSYITAQPADQTLDSNGRKMYPSTSDRSALASGRWAETCQHIDEEIEVDREVIAAYVAAWNLEPIYIGCSDSVMCARDLDWNHACVGELKYIGY